MTTTNELSALLNTRDAAAFCGLSKAAWYKYKSAGRLPAPVQIGGAQRWRRAELEAWIAAGCPTRQKWELLRKNK